MEMTVIAMSEKGPWTVTSGGRMGRRGLDPPSAVAAAFCEGQAWAPGSWAAWLAASNWNVECSTSKWCARQC